MKEIYNLANELKAIVEGLVYGSVFTSSNSIPEWHKAQIDRIVQEAYTVGFNDGKRSRDKGGNDE